MPIQQPHIFKNALGLVVVGLAVIGGTASAWVFFGHHFWTALKGPTEVTLADIAKLEDPRQLPSTWVKVKFDKSAKSEVVMEVVGSGVSSIDEEYLIFQAGERWMIASVPPHFSGNVISGQIWRNNAPLARQAVAAVAEDLLEVHQGKLFPFEFDAGDDYGKNWTAFAAVMAMLAACGGLLGFLGLGGVIASFRAPGPADYGLAADGEEDPYDPAAPASNDFLARYLREGR